jgi:SAM-dependent methyltransferase
MIDLAHCPVCRSTDLKWAYSAPTTRGLDKVFWNVSECNGCGHQFMNPQPTWEELEPYYGQAYDPYDPMHGSLANDEGEIAEAKRTGLLRHIRIPDGLRLLDVGCGGGRFLRIAKKLGAIEQGVEPSAYAADVAKKQGLNVFHGTIEDFAAHTENTFDIITANHVVEHVPDPVKTLETMKKLLAPGGFIWISVPNAAYPISRALKGYWHSSDLPYHLMQFSPDSIAKAGNLAGLKVRRQTTESMPSAVESSLGLYFRYRWMLPRKLTHRTGLLPPIARWLSKTMDEKKNGEAVLTEFV